MPIVRFLVAEVHPVLAQERYCINRGRNPSFNEISIADPYSMGVLGELDGRAAPSLRKLWYVIPPRPILKIEKLSDNFGQFVITLRCECGHTRNASPKTFAGIAGWDAKLADVVKRARCSKCRRRGRCTVSVRHEYKRDG